MPYRERFVMEDVPQDFAKSEVCQEYCALRAILQVYLWHLETTLTYKGLQWLMVVANGYNYNLRLARSYNHPALKKC